MLGVIAFVLSFFGAFLETLGVSVVVPFINALVDPEALLHDQRFKRIFELFSINKDNVVLYVCVGIIIVYIVKNLFLVFLLWFTSQYSISINRKLSERIMKAFLDKDYPFFLNADMGQLTFQTTGEPQRVCAFILSFSSLVSELLVMLLICLFVLINDWKMALCVILAGLVCLLINTIIFAKKMKREGEEYQIVGAKKTSTVLTSYQGVKEIMVSKTKDYFLSKYETIGKEYQRLSVRATVASGAPKYFIEIVFIVSVIGAVGIKVLGKGNVSVYISQLAVFALAAIRLMPSLGRIAASFNNMINVSPSISAIYEVMNNICTVGSEGERTTIISEIKTDVELSFNHLIEIQHINWSYDGKREILQELSLSITKNQCIGIMGASGEGKSTLMDVLLGLLRPQKGSIFCDGKDIFDYPEAWSKLVGYVPQSIFLINDKIRNNVAFGVAEEGIDDNRVWEALSSAQIADDIKMLPQNIYTETGERGVRLSGGQRQRIAIARALYRNPEIIVFDEATSALDNETESAVMESIEKLQGNKTMIIVAHRLTTIRNCDKIYEVINHRVVERSKEELFGEQ